MTWFRYTYNRCADLGFAQHPRQCHLSTRNTPSCRDTADRINDRAVFFLMLGIQRTAVSVALRASGAFLPVTRQPTTRQWTPRQYADLLISAQGQHFALFFTTEQIQMVLHADKTGPTIKPGCIQGLTELPGVHRRSAYVA